MSLFSDDPAPVRKAPIAINWAVELSRKLDAIMAAVQRVEAAGPQPDVSRVIDALGGIGEAIRAASVQAAVPGAAVDLGPVEARIDGIAGMMAEIIQRPALPVPASGMKPLRWEFSIERDANGLMTLISATPIYEEEFNGIGKA